jgi:hypothetical protein
VVALPKKEEFAKNVAVSNGKSTLSKGTFVTDEAVSTPLDTTNLKPNFFAMEENHFAIFVDGIKPQKFLRYII